MSEFIREQGTQSIDVVANQIRENYRTLQDFIAVHHGGMHDLETGTPSNAILD